MGEVAVARAQTPAPYTADQLKLIQNTLAKDTTPDEFDLFIEMARRSNLDPIRKQIYAIVHNADDPKKRKLTIITGIDGYRKIAAGCGDYRPSDEPPHFEYDAGLKGPLNPLGLVSATVRAYKYVHGEWHAVAGTAYWDEYAPLREIWAYDQAQNKRAPTGEKELMPGNWVSKGRVMLAKCAEAQALRRGWPEDVSGLYADDEMESTAMQIIEVAEDARRVKLIGGDVISIVLNPGGVLDNVPEGEFADRVLEYLRTVKSAADLASWREQNKAALQIFWTRRKAEALELKKMIEARAAELATATEGA